MPQPKRLRLIALLMLLILSARPATSAGPKVVEFQPLDQIGMSAKSAKGPNDSAAVELIGASVPMTFTLINDTNPGIDTPDYVVSGRVKYEGAAAGSYLEMWNFFGSKGQYFTRTLAESGSMGKLQGSSDWRQFELPFHAEAGMKPERIVVNLVLMGPGTVTVEQPTIRELPANGIAIWSMVGGILGGLLGLFYGLLGSAIGICASYEKLRKWSLPVLQFGFMMSGAILVAGLVSVAVKLPYEVCYPLILGGVIGMLVLGINWRTIAKRLHDDELRKINAVDAV